MIEIIIPEIIIGIFAIVVLLLPRTGIKPLYITLIGLMMGLLFSLNPIYGIAFNNSIKVDTLSTLFRLIFIGITTLVTLASVEFKDIQTYFSLLLTALLGMLITSSSGDLIVLYMGLELTALSTYCLVGFTKKKISIEASMKYFLSGAFFSAVTLFGISLVYGLTGSIYFNDILIPQNPVGLIAVLFLIGGFGFKAAIVPFHMWLADTHSGAPTPISAFLSGGVVNLAFVAFLRVFLSISTLSSEWGLILAVLSILTMSFGNIVALSQRAIKRMFAYSTIAQMGYILVGIAISSEYGDIGKFAIMASLLHLTVHLFMKGGAFIAVGSIYDTIGHEIEDYIGLRKRAPVTAFFMTIFLISLAGLVPMGGFISKLLLLISTIKSNNYMFILGISLLLNSIISCVYYGRIIRNMYFMQPDNEEKVEIPIGFIVAMGISAIIVILIGIYPTPFVEFINNVSVSL